MTLTENEEKIQGKSSRYFPSQEIWIKDDRDFYAMKHSGNMYTVTKGYIEDGIISWKTKRVNFSSSFTAQRYIDRFLDHISENYVCYAMLM